MLFFLLNKIWVKKENKSAADVNTSFDLLNLTKNNKTNKPGILSCDSWWFRIKNLVHYPFTLGHGIRQKYVVLVYRIKTSQNVTALAVHFYVAGFVVWLATMILLGARVGVNVRFNGKYDEPKHKAGNQFDPKP